MAKKNIKINVVEQIGQIMARITHDGENLHNIIVQSLEEKRKVTLDFSEIDMVTSSFLNACIGQLYSKYDSEFIEKNLIVVNLKPESEATLKRVQDWAKNYFKKEKAV